MSVIDRRLGGWGAAALLVLAALAGLAAAPTWAYERYRDGCNDCHGGFTASGYYSAATGAAWPSSLHTVHRSSSYMNTDCDLCHSSGDNDNPFIGSSNGTGHNVGYGCVGCHGSPTEAGAPTGASLRRHHTYTGVTQCVSCHVAPGPLAQESIPPPYYGTADTNVAAACNDDTGSSEDWNNDGKGLDNDGDLEWDLADPACHAGFLFHDGFVSGDTSSWGAGVPAH